MYNVLKRNVDLFFHYFFYSDISINTLKVRAGEYDTKLDAEREPKPHQERTVSQIIQHPNFHPKSLHNDLALVVVSQPFVFDTHIIPICIQTLNVAGPFDTTGYDPRNCVATGWGKSDFGKFYYFIIIVITITVIL